MIEWLTSVRFAVALIVVVVIAACALSIGIFVAVSSHQGHDQGPPLLVFSSIERAGEHCSGADHGVTLHGEYGRLTCENNDGWHWEERLVRLGLPSLDDLGQPAPAFLGPVVARLSGFGLERGLPRPRRQASRRARSPGERR
jgi:hypothetical protein